MFNKRRVISNIDHSILSHIRPVGLSTLLPASTQSRLTIHSANFIIRIHLFPLPFHMAFDLGPRLYYTLLPGVRTEGPQPRRKCWENATKGVGRMHDESTVYERQTSANNRSLNSDGRVGNICLAQETLSKSRGIITLSWRSLGRYGSLRGNSLIRWKLVIIGPSGTQQIGSPLTPQRRLCAQLP